MKERHARRSDILIVLALVGLIAVAYGQVHDFSLLDYDDDNTITLNAHVQSGLSIQNVKWAFTTDYQCFRMPMVWLSFMQDREIADLAAAHGVHLGPDNAGVLHLTNVLFHAASTILLFFLLLRLTGCRYRSALVAALFAVHPLHVESVAWVTERKDVLSGFFGMLTILFYAAYARRPGIARYLLVMAVFSLGLLAKSMLVTLPVLLLVMDYWPLKRLGSFADIRRDGWRMLREKIPLLVLALVACAFTYSAQQGTGAIMPVDLLPMGVRVANALASYLVYAWQMIWPRGLAPFYPHPGSAIAAIPTMAGALWVVGASLYALRAARGRPYVLFGWLWYVISLVPVIGLVQMGRQAHADRYTYLPLIGLFVGVAWLIADVAGERMHPAKSRLAGVVVSSVLICFLTTLAHDQVSKWRDNVTLFTHTLRCSPRNPVAYCTLGVKMIRQRRFGRAEEYLRKALEIWPDYSTPRHNLGIVMEQIGNVDEAIGCYEMALTGAKPQNIATIEMNLGRVMVKKGRYADALAHVRAGVAANPDALGVHNNLGFVLGLLGRDAEAESEYRRELRIDPRSFDACLNLGRLMAKHEGHSGAAKYLSQAAGIRPSSFESHLELASALARAGKSGEAVRHYHEAIKLQPGNPVPANSLAWLLSTCSDAKVRNGGEALLLALSVCGKTGYGDPSALDTLAAAYAETGRFGDAVRTASRAVRLAESMGHKSLAGQIRSRVVSYRAGSAFREPNP